METVMFMHVCFSEGWWRKPSLWTRWRRCWTGCRRWCMGRWRRSSSTRLTPTCCCSGSSSHRPRSFTCDCRATYPSWRAGEQWGGKPMTVYCSSFIQKVTWSSTATVHHVYIQGLYSAFWVLKVSFFFIFWLSQHKCTPCHTKQKRRSKKVPKIAGFIGQTKQCHSKVRSALGLWTNDSPSCSWE